MAAPSAASSGGAEVESDFSATHSVQKIAAKSRGLRRRNTDQAAENSISTTVLQNLGEFEKTEKEVEGQKLKGHVVDETRRTRLIGRYPGKKFYKELFKKFNEDSGDRGRQKSGQEQNVEVDEGLCAGIDAHETSPPNRGPIILWFQTSGACKPHEFAGILDFLNELKTGCTHQCTVLTEGVNYICRCGLDQKYPSLFTSKYMRHFDKLFVQLLDDTPAGPHQVNKFLASHKGILRLFVSDENLTKIQSVPQGGSYEPVKSLVLELVETKIGRRLFGFAAEKLVLEDIVRVHWEGVTKIFEEPVNITLEKIQAVRDLMIRKIKDIPSVDIVPKKRILRMLWRGQPCDVDVCSQEDREKSNKTYSQKSGGTSSLRN